MDSFFPHTPRVIKTILHTVKQLTPSAVFVMKPVRSKVCVDDPVDIFIGRFPGKMSPQEGLHLRESRIRRVRP